MEKRWLVTGAQGFLGRYVTAAILDSDSSAVVRGIGRSQPVPGRFSHTISSPRGPTLAPLTPELARSLASRYEYEIVDVEERAHLFACIRQFQPDFVVHLAAALRGN